MIIVKGKKLKLILMCVILTIIITIIILNMKKDINTTETVALPVNKKVIIVDAGHGRRRWRSNNGRPEYQSQT